MTPTFRLSTTPRVWLAVTLAALCWPAAALAAPSVTVTFQTASGPQRVVGAPVAGNALQGARFVLGRPGAKNTIVEFGNYLCSHCQDWAGQVQGQLIKELVKTGVARFAYRDLPFAGQVNARLAAGSAACAADQGKYWAFHDLLYGAAGRWGVLDEQTLRSQMSLYASVVGLEPNAFVACLKSGAHLAAVDADAEAAQGFKITGTPAFIVNGVLFEGALPIEAFKAILKVKAR